MCHDWTIHDDDDCDEMHEDEQKKTRMLPCHNIEGRNNNAPRLDL